MLRRLLTICLLAPTLALSQNEEKQFQVLVAEKATIYGIEVEPLKYVDDVTSIEVAEGGFVSLVHQGGTTYESKEKVFTFYLKPEELKDRKERPNLSILYSDSTVLDPTKLITVLDPVFDRSGYLIWNESENLKIGWHLHDEPVLVYVISLYTHDGQKIQDLRTKNHNYVLKPSTYGLSTPAFEFEVSSTFAGETITSKRYHVELKPAATYELKASDIVLKALNLELAPLLALEAWQEALQMPNGEFYQPLFELFVKRNTDTLSAGGKDVNQLLTENK